MIPIAIALITVIVWIVWSKFEQNRQRDKDVVNRLVGGVDISTWWKTFSEGYGHFLRKDEQGRLRTPHDLEQPQAAVREDLPKDHADWDTISLCYDDRADPFPHKHYFLQMTNSKTNPPQNWTLDFSLNHHTKKGEVTLSFKTQTCTTEATKPITEDILNRIVSVKNSTNFSYCLRNSEHFARYINDGTWQSSQLTQNRYMRQIFDEIMSAEDRKKIATVPEDVQRTIPNDKFDLMFQNLTGMAEFKKRTILDGFSFPKNDFNIIVVGPTGAGKSTIINLLFNKKVCKIQEKEETNFASVTRQAQVLTGVHKCPDGYISVNILDTMGFCDIFLDNNEALDNMFSDIGSEHSKIDRVVFVCYGIIQDSHQKALKSLMDRLQYPRKGEIDQTEDVKRKRNNFVFIYHKTEKMSDEQKLEKLDDMGDKLGVDIGHKIPVIMLKKGMEDSAVFETCNINAGRTTGINTSGQLDDATQKTAKELKDILLPHTREVLKSPERLSIAQNQCSIQ